MLPPGWLAGRAVLVGSMIPGIDEHRTLASAFGKPSFGVEIHAAVLSQLLAGRAVPAPRCPGCAATAAAAALGIALGAALSGYAVLAALVAAALTDPGAGACRRGARPAGGARCRAGAGLPVCRRSDARLARPRRTARPPHPATAVLALRQRAGGGTDPGAARTVPFRRPPGAAGTDRDGAVLRRRRLHHFMRTASAGAAGGMARPLHRSHGAHRRRA